MTAVDLICCSIIVFTCSYQIWKVRTNRLSDKSYVFVMLDMTATRKRFSWLFYLTSTHNNQHIKADEWHKVLCSSLHAFMYNIFPNYLLRCYVFYPFYYLQPCSICPCSHTSRNYHHNICDHIIIVCNHSPV